MSSKNNVIDLSQRRQKEKVKSTKSEKKNETAAAPVLDITEIRQEMIKQERRQVKRTILTEFIGAYAVVPNQGLAKVTIYDISENGVAFDLDFKLGQFRIGEEVAMRVYMNGTTYFPFHVKIQNLREVTDEATSRHGANFVKGTINSEALHHLVKFIETVSASLERDNGDVMVSNLKK